MTALTDGPITLPRWFDGACTAAAFLLGGIGTGNVSLGARGELRDWEIFGTAGKGNALPNTFFALRYASHGTEPVARVLEGPIPPPYTRSHGFVDHEVAGLPRCATARLKGEYPFATVELRDPALPLTITLEAFTPFVPLDADDSGLPVAILRYQVQHHGDQPADVAVVGSLANLTALEAFEQHTWRAIRMADGVRNAYRDDGVLRGLWFEPRTLTPAHRCYRTMSLTTPDGGVSCKRRWLNGGWWDGLQEFWDDFCDDGRLDAEPGYVERDAPADFDDRIGSLAIARTLAPGATATFTFVLSWHVPWRPRSWSERMYHEVRERGARVAPDAAGGLPLMRTYYSLRFADAWGAARFAIDQLPRLERASRAFRDALYGSTVPAEIVEAIGATLTALRSPSCFRLEDGTLMAWEGCFDDEGCCEGNCTHVLNYSQTVAYLFPALERSMRRLEYLVETTPAGKMHFRSYQPFGMDGHDHVPAADGQLGTLVRLYREWRLSGDEAFLREVWPRAAQTLDFAFDAWDRDGDGVLDTDLFNTYDISFQGPTSMVNSLFLAALLAGAELAGHLGEPERAARYRAAFARGSAGTDALLWGGDYYVQRLVSRDEQRYQYGGGCLSDQLFGQTLAHLSGLGYLLPVEHVRAAIHAVFRHNWRTSFVNHHNAQRTYALNEEHGLILCSWPAGGRPRLPFPYADEVWTGIEYHVATHLIYEGALAEARTIVQGVRARHDGVRRNPWDEVECGHHYMRSLASYGLLVAWSGVVADLPHGTIRFAPWAAGARFQCLFACDAAWGIYHREVDASGAVRQWLEVLGGDAGALTLLP